jgi:hypothetical protein
MVAKLGGFAAFHEEEISLDGVALPHLPRVRDALKPLGEDRNIKLIRLKRSAELACGRGLPREEFFVETDLRVGYFIGRGQMKRPFTAALSGKGPNPDDALKDLLETIQRPSRKALKGLQKLMPWRALVVKFQSDGGYQARRPLGFGITLRHDRTL